LKGGQSRLSKIYHYPVIKNQNLMENQMKGGEAMKEAISGMKKFF